MDSEEPSNKQKNDENYRYFPSLSFFERSCLYHRRSIFYVNLEDEPRHNQHNNIQLDSIETKMI